MACLSKDTHLARLMHTRLYACLYMQGRMQASSNSVKRQTSDEKPHCTTPVYKNWSTHLPQSGARAADFDP